MDKISIASYSFRNSIKNGMSFDKIADKLNEWGVKFVEINNSFTTPKELPEVAKTFKNKGITPILVTIDGNNYFQKTPGGREGQFKWMKPWIDATHAAGITTIRANMGHFGNMLFKGGAFKQFVANFTPILEYCEKLGITHTFENHGGLSSDVNFQLKVKAAFPSKFMGYLLDFGNYRPKSLVYENIGKLKDAIKIIHAKAYEFNADEEDTQLDYKRIIDELKKVGYDGYYSIEYEGSLKDLDGILLTYKLLKKYL
jgi:sugar phosphate isomerase/epimerase